MENNNNSDKLKRKLIDNALQKHLQQQNAKRVPVSNLNKHINLYNTVSNTKEENSNSLNGLHQFLLGSKIKAVPNLPDSFPKVNTLESPCAGKYESCLKNEITEQELRLLRTKTDETVPKPKSVSTQNTIGNFLKPSREPLVQEVKPIEHPKAFYNGFRTAREELTIQNIKKYGNAGISQSQSAGGSNIENPSTTGRTLGIRRNVHSHFVCPTREEIHANKVEESKPQDERLRSIDPKMVELIENEIMKKHETVSWDDIAGLDYAKSVIEEIVIAALLRPDLYRGLRRPPRGVLLFGPPGTGKTLIGRCIASQSKSTFFSISASSITSKYVGESEKMVRALFAIATVHQPAVIFIDEIDSMLCRRSEGEQEHSRRLKNEFLVQLDGTTTSEDDRIVVVGATNRPQELDEAARRRLVRRLYIPLPDLSARLHLIKNLLTKVKHNLNSNEIEEIANLTDGYSCADIKSLLHESALKPLRGISYTQLMSYSEENVRPVNKADICASLRTVRPTVAKTDLEPYLEWNRLYGTVRENEEEC